LTVMPGPLAAILMSTTSSRSAAYGMLRKSPSSAIGADTDTEQSTGFGKHTVNSFPTPQCRCRPNSRSKTENRALKSVPRVCGQRVDHEPVR
jgi:hypothetical protein